MYINGHKEIINAEINSQNVAGEMGNIGKVQASLA